MTESIFISTTIPYVNARPHLGHAFEFAQTDAFARASRQRSGDTFFLTGSDENSLKNVLAAEKEGIPVRELVDRNVIYFQDLVSRMGLSNNHFIRTSADQEHREGARRFWQLMAERDDIYLKSYSGLYCVGCEQFYTPAELVEGKCPEHLTVPELVSEENYFFRLSRYQEPLLEALQSGRIKITPETRLNEVVSFVQSGLVDISISRSTKRARGWGIPVPGDEQQVMYVWIDALINYITGLGWANNDPRYTKYWEQASKRIHVVGKGVTRFHAVYWPAMLMSAGLPLPTDIFVHGYITANGQKLSKSLGNTVDPEELVTRYGENALRYYLLADFSPFNDGDFSEERLILRYNNDLANELGNLVSRVTSMIQRYCAGVVPAAGKLTDDEASLEARMSASSMGARAAMERYDHREALFAIWELVRQVNVYLNATEPWQLAKAAKTGSESAIDRLNTVLYHAALALCQIGTLLLPFLPDPANTILETFGTNAGTLDGQMIRPEDLTGTKIAKSENLFPRMDFTQD